MKTDRKAEIQRKTNETDIELSLNLDGAGNSTINTPSGFLNHMLQLLARHSGIDIELKAEGDTEVDDHHLVEDIGICLGQALGQALGGKEGIGRYGFFVLPMDEVLVAAAVDLGGRFAFSSDYSPQREMVGQFSTELVNHFFTSMACEGRMNLHFKLLNAGENEHHRIEAMFKSFARAIRVAIAVDGRLKGQVPSTKGML